MYVVEDVRIVLDPRPLTLFYITESDKAKLK
jgi:hypothetical protein